MPNSKKRRSFEQGHFRKFLLVVDESAEVESALYYAASRIQHSSGSIIMLYVIEPQEFQHWMGVKQVHLEEQTNKAKALFRLFRRKLALAGFDAVAVEEVIREGKAAEQLVALIDADEDIATGLVPFEALARRQHDTLFVVVGARGFPLGEHGRLGPCDEPLFNELLQQVSLWRFPDTRAAAQRSGALSVPADLPGTVLDVLGIRPADPPDRWTSLWPIANDRADALRDRIVICGAGGERAIRTPAWLCSLSADDPPRVRLFAKPADRWEVNEVSDRAAPIAAALQAAIAESLAVPEPTRWPPLADELVTEVD